MNLTRREFLEVLVAASAAGFSLNSWAGTRPNWKDVPPDFYDLPRFGNVSLLHYTDCHAQLNPIYFREPNINIGVGDMHGKPPVLVGDKLLGHFGIKPGTPMAHAVTHLDFTEAARKYGRVGGFAHLSTLVKKLRAERPGALLLDGGDTWQGSATSLWTNAQDMVDAQKLLGVDVMIGHWEFTFGEERVLEVVENDFKDAGIDWVAQNIVDVDWEEPVFDPYVIREVNGVPVAIIGQAFPYTPVANPQYMIPNWSFGIRDSRMQRMVEEARAAGAKAVIVLSHNGMVTDFEMARRVQGIDVIMGGHTHDAIPGAVEVDNGNGKTIVTNAGSNGKFLGVMDLDVRDNGVRDYRFKLVPVFSNLLEPDREMSEYIQKVRAPYADKLSEELAVSDDLLYRRGNFNGTFDEVIIQAMLREMDAEIAFSPGFRWGVSVLPGQPITFEDLMTQTVTTYSEITRNEMTGEQIKFVMEDVANSIFNANPYLHRGGDMVRTGGLRYTIDPHQSLGNRISDLEVNGEPMKADKRYVVAGWASVAAPVDDRPIWEVVEDYLRDVKTVRVGEPYTPRLKNVEGDPGLDI
ncbi:thiosulfohydrolase SoxB [Thioalkalivibrio denitrificans]|uniref:Thiosulfohydrolase SoxB n=1 Tax=Thioalkalivibrio denitrificans TaxID=108003 RepID=A0A1V3NFI9_9GAMM|nr:thiosulfohydrolase SoxB [Thioalkalivibrio denitrificans]OOG23693.1 thiosulfohydrolase SoxB [Thioalkalivibrio denitrificans]